MRLYMNASEMYEEVKRDLAEMGIEVHPKTMQDKNIEGNPDYYTKELQNYSYSLLIPSFTDIADAMPVNLEWANAEFAERVTDPFNRQVTYGTGAHPFRPVNPGEAYKIREEIWNDYLDAHGKFAYTYNERIWQNDQLTKLINRLSEDHDSRQIWLSIWDPNRDTDKLGGISRVPCSLGYDFQIREGKLNMHYVMRSCDFVTHFSNDVYLAVRLLFWVAAKIGVEVGTFTHTMFSLHVYNKDIQGVF